MDKNYKEIKDIVKFADSAVDEVVKQYANSAITVLSPESADRLLKKINKKANGISYIDLSAKIYTYIKENSFCKAKDIAEEFDISRKDVNHVLYKKEEYGLADFLIKNSKHEWALDYSKK
tara:strand:- start:29 stop:388 length:360 start_codon:yes stop_codon:yes gene_type:complete